MVAKLFLNMVTKYASSFEAERADAFYSCTLMLSLPEQALGTAETFTELLGKVVVQIFEDLNNKQSSNPAFRKDAENKWLQIATAQKNRNLPKLAPTTVTHLGQLFQALPGEYAQRIGQINSMQMDSEIKMTTFQNYSTILHKFKHENQPFIRFSELLIKSSNLIIKSQEM